MSGLDAKMEGKRPNKGYAEDVLRRRFLFDEDPNEPVSAEDSSSDDEDLMLDIDSDSDCYPSDDEQHGPHPDCAPLSPMFSSASDSDSDGEEQPGEEQPGEEQPGEEQPGEGQPGEGQPGEGQPGEGQPGEGQPGEEQPGGEGQKRKARTKSKTPRKRARVESEEEEEQQQRWHDCQEKDKKPNPIKFRPARTPGPQIDTTKSWSPLELFQLFFSDSVIRTIIRNTNANAARRLKAGKKFKWENLTVQSFYTFMSIIIFTGLVTVHNRADYWKTALPYGFIFPGNKMTRGRFETILWSLHLSDPAEDEENDKKKKEKKEYDRLFKIKPLYNEIVDACKSYFHPHQNISIDERMVASKARISFKQYIKNKPTKWGYKLFVLADSFTAYTWNFFVYSGKGVSTTEQQGLSYTSVMDLLPCDLLGGGYTVYTDNYYTSPKLVKDLAKKFIGCCGTIRKNRLVGVSEATENDLPKNAKRGDLRWIRRNNLLYVKWMDTREVTLCSSVHEAFTGQTVTRRVKEAGEWKIKSVPVPDAVLDYNHNMGGVDLSDALIGYYSVSRKTMKWYKTFFYHFVDIAVVNSFLIHKELLKLRNPDQVKPHTQKTFREQLLREMVEFNDSSAASDPTPDTCMPAFYVGDDESDRIRKHCRRCLEAGMPRVKTAIYCRRCEVPLCMTSKKNCFQLWHDEP